MREHWLIDVLADLRKFSENNSMAELTEQLDDTIRIAASEMARAEQDCGKKTNLKHGAFLV